MVSIACGFQAIQRATATDFNKTIKYQKLTPKRIRKNKKDKRQIQ